MTTIIDLESKLKEATSGYTYNGIPVTEFGDAGEWLVSVGHVDKAAFVAAADAYCRETCEESLLDRYCGAVSLADLAVDVKHDRAEITDLAEFPDGEFGLRFGAGDINVTTLAVG